MDQAECECAVECQEEVVHIYDNVTIPFDSQTEIMVPADIVSETVIVTTSPDPVDPDNTEICIKEVAGLGTSDTADEIEVDKTDSAVGFVVSAEETADGSCARENKSYNVVTTLHHLSAGSLWNVDGMLEDFTRLRDRLKKRKQRKNPEYRRKETDKARARMAKRRNDPAIREMERKKDRERRAAARQKKGVREKERARDKQYKKQLRDKTKNTAAELDCLGDEEVVIVDDGKTFVESYNVVEVRSDEYTETPVKNNVVNVRSDLDPENLGKDSNGMFVSNTYVAEPLTTRHVRSRTRSLKSGKISSLNSDDPSEPLTAVKNGSRIYSSPSVTETI